MKRMQDLMGHTERVIDNYDEQMFIMYRVCGLQVLYLAISPDGRTVCSGAGDETLRMWKCFDVKSSKGQSSGLQKSGSSKVAPCFAIR